MAKMSFSHFVIRVGLEQHSSQNKDRWDADDAMMGFLIVSVVLSLSKSWKASEIYLV